MDRHSLQDAVAQAPEVITPAARSGLEQALDLATWLDIYRPQVVF
jgi:asparagine synthase (glutamine-hydrolysing)